MSIPASLQHLRLPIICSPLFIASQPRLVIEQCKAGLVGSFPALNARPATQLADWIDEISETLASAASEPGREYPVAPFAVNQIDHASNPRVDEDMKVCVDRKVPMIISSLRAHKEFIDEVHRYGGVYFHDVINIRHARKAIEAGVDGLILVCAGAGGHAGTMSPFALLSEVREIFDGPIVLAGAISTGSGVLAAIAAGADFAYMGTRWLATPEAVVSDAYRQMIVDSAAADIRYTDYFSGVSGNYLGKSIAAVGMDPDQIPKRDPDKRLDMSEKDTKAKIKPWRDVWSAGQGVGTIHSVQTVREMADQLDHEYHAAAVRTARIAASA
ncbi:nitronate monooxygenase [Nevskia sp.]|uniref:NAD(P)H-dependent flavin oxidoreductase n=1 Tax=Nevskia sp. TaxID=1929292 RepID=UPI00345A9BEE